MINRTPLSIEWKRHLEQIASRLTQTASTQYVPGQDSKDFVQ